jgi:hypothetical protein
MAFKAEIIQSRSHSKPFQNIGPIKSPVSLLLFPTPVLSKTFRRLQIPKAKLKLPESSESTVKLIGTLIKGF